MSGCGCGKQASDAQWTVTPSDGSGVKSFSSKPEADVYAARTGGIIKRKAT